MPVQGHSLELLLFVERPGPKGLLPSAFSMVTALRLCYTSIQICNSTDRHEGYFDGKLAASRSVNVTVGRRSREYLTEREVERLIEAAKQNRSGHRDATAILVAYRHGLRASELVALCWDDIDPSCAPHRYSDPRGFSRS